MMAPEGQALILYAVFLLQFVYVCVNVDIISAACKEEKLTMMTCWKKHDFKENTCDEEYKAFSRCISAVRVGSLYML